jgi:hypothetical protein
MADGGDADDPTAAESEEAPEEASVFPCAPPAEFRDALPGE